MNKHALGRRHFLKSLTAIGTASLPIASVFGSRLAFAADKAVKTAYDPAGKFEITVSEVEMRRNSAGRMLKARIYQPKGAGPFPTVLDLHGGAWNAKDRTAEEPMDRAIASSGVLVVAIDMTLAGEAPYPACVQDANYGVRWLKSKAATWNGDPSKIGIYGSSSGGQVAELLGMRPHDSRYNAIPLPEAPHADATVEYAAMRSPVSDPLARYKNAEKRERESMMKNHTVFFNPSTGDPRPPRENHARAVPDHGRLARRQRVAGDSEKVRCVIQGGRRRHPIPDLRRRRARVGRQPRAANRPGAGDGQGVHRASTEGMSDGRRISLLPRTQVL
jgi:acetyl esterase